MYFYGPVLIAGVNKKVIEDVVEEGERKHTDSIYIKNNHTGDNIYIYMTHHDWSYDSSSCKDKRNKGCQHKRVWATFNKVFSRELFAVFDKTKVKK